MPFSSPRSPAEPSAFRSRPSIQSASAIIDTGDLHPLEQTFRLLPDVVSIYDVDAQQSVYSNRTFASVLGYADDITPDDDLLHPDDAAAMNAQLQQTLALNDDESSDVAYRLKHAN